MPRLVSIPTMLGKLLETAEARAEVLKLHQILEQATGVVDSATVALEIDLPRDIFELVFLIHFVASQHDYRACLIVSEIRSDPCYKDLKQDTVEDLLRIWWPRKSKRLLVLALVAAAVLLGLAVVLLSSDLSGASW